MTSGISATIEQQNDGYKASRWTKNGDRGLTDRIYVDAADGTKVGFYDLVKGNWVLDKNNRTHMIGLVDDATEAKVVLNVMGRGVVNIGEKMSLMPHEGPIFGHGANLTKDWLIANGRADQLSLDDFFDACFEGGEAWLNEHRRRYNWLGDVVEYRVTIGNGNILVFADDPNDKKLLRISVVEKDDPNSGLFLGHCKREEVKRVGRSVWNKHRKV